MNVKCATTNDTGTGKIYLERFCRQGRGDLSPAFWPQIRGHDLTAQRLDASLTLS